MTRTTEHRSEFGSMDFEISELITELQRIRDANPTAISINFEEVWAGYEDMSNELVLVLPETDNERLVREEKEVWLIAQLEEKSRRENELLQIEVKLQNRRKEIEELEAMR